MISFSPKFVCDPSQHENRTETSKTGDCYAIIYIPPQTDVWLNPPPEVVQPDNSTCWAAAISSFSRIVPGILKFRSRMSVIEKFQKVEFIIGKNRYPLLKWDGALIKQPQKDIVSKGKKLFAGQWSVERIANEIGSTYTLKRNSFELDDVKYIFEKSGNPFVVLKSNEGPVGHGTVVFGFSEIDSIVGEMDPFEVAKENEEFTGSAYGNKNTIWVPPFEKINGSYNNFYTLFKLKKNTSNFVNTEEYEHELDLIKVQLENKSDSFLSFPMDYESRDELEVEEETPALSASPIPGNYYRIKKGDSLLKIAGKAYNVGAGQRRLLFARLINSHSLNSKYHLKSSSSFSKKYFPDGIISFYPRFSCNSEELLNNHKKPAKGKCFAILWIPEKQFNYHPYLGKGKPNNLFAGEVQHEQEDPEVKRDILPRKEILKAPSRWICALELTFKDPDDETKSNHYLGTGFLISPNHVLTCAHNLYQVIYGNKGTPKAMQVSAIRIAPGVNGWRSRDYTFGIYELRNPEDNIAVHYNWKRRNDRFKTLPISPLIKKNFGYAMDQETSQYDFGLIKLNEPIGNKKFRKLNNKPLGYWGANKFSSISAVRPKLSSGTEINIVGYDFFHRGKEGFRQMKSVNTVDSIYEDDNYLIEYGIKNTQKGQSGAPIYLITKKKGRPLIKLLGINVQHGYGVLLTKEVSDFIKKMKLMVK